MNLFFLHEPNVLSPRPSFYRVIILCMGSTNERWRYVVTLSLIGGAHTQNNPCHAANRTIEKQMYIWVPRRTQGPYTDRGCLQWMTQCIPGSPVRSFENEWWWNPSFPYYWPSVREIKQEMVSQHALLIRMFWFSLLPKQSANLKKISDLFGRLFHSLIAQPLRAVQGDCHPGTVSGLRKTVEIFTITWVHDPLRSRQSSPISKPNNRKMVPAQLWKPCPGSHVPNLSDKSYYHHDKTV